MIHTEIIKALSKSERWGTNYQPHNKRVLALQLAHLPIEYLRMKTEATLSIVLHRPLEGREWMILGYLNADSPNWDDCSDDQTHFEFWWD